MGYQPLIFIICLILPTVLLSLIVFFDTLSRIIVFKPTHMTFE